MEEATFSDTGGTAGRRKASHLALRLVPLAIVILIILLAWLSLTGRVFFWTEQVELVDPTTVESGGNVYYQAHFDGGVRNESSAMEAAQGTAQVTLGLWDYQEAGWGRIDFNIWQAMETRVRNLHLRLQVPQEWGRLLWEVPQGSGYGAIRHEVGIDGLSLDFPRLGWGWDGLSGSVFLTFHPEAALWGGTAQFDDPQQTVRVEFDFDLHGTGLRRLVKWHVHGLWELPAATGAVGM